MSLPPILRDRLRLPVIGSPLFIISNPDLVIAQCTSGVVGSFPSLNARPENVTPDGKGFSIGGAGGTNPPGTVMLG